MSESMAFIGGVAVAGLAALVLLKGTNTPLQSNFAIPQMPTTVMPPQVMPQQFPYNNYPPQPSSNPPVAPNPSQSAELEKINAQLENFKKDNEQLKQQNLQLQSQVQNYIWQTQQIAQNSQLRAPLPAALPPQTETQWWESKSIMWAVGGATLTIGGGVVVAGVLALFSPRQRNTRTVQVIHPYNGSTSHLTPIRRAEFLPSRVDARRVEAPEYDEMH